MNNARRALPSFALAEYIVSARTLRQVGGCRTLSRGRARRGFALSKILAGTTLTLCSCGSRTELDPAPIDASPYVDLSLECRSDLDCVDPIRCTEERCNGAPGRCQRRERHDRCNDGVFCNGVEQCDAELGCAPGADPCSDGIECSEDSCDEASRGCFHEPVDTLCPPSHRCDLERGCVPHLLVHDPMRVYELEPSSFELTLLTTVATNLTDIAVSERNELYGVDSGGQVLLIDPRTGSLTSLAQAPLPGLNGMDIAPDGSLYLSGGSSVFRFEGGNLNPVATLPSRNISSGDIVVMDDGRFLVTARSTDVLSDDVLVEIDSTGSARIVGSIEFTCVFGLAILQGELFGFTCSGQVLRIDPASAASELVTRVDAGLWGAAGR